MSAYICDKSHLVYLAAAAASRSLSSYGAFTWHHGEMRHELPVSDYNRMAEIANMLLMKNIASVCGRYRQASSANLPGPTEHYHVTARDVSAACLRFDPVQVIKSCDCYEYQACEHDGWETSEAKAFIDRLRRTACHALPGYDAAAWGAPERKQAA